MARYLCHMDQPDKHRYEIQDVVSIGSIDYASLCMSAADEDDMLDQIFETMDSYALDSYPGRALDSRAQSRVETHRVPEVHEAD